jgi:putative nucleotidyltransferase with HDIG domain
MTSRSRNTYFAGQIAVLAALLALTAMSSHARDWRAIPLIALLAVLAVGSERMKIAVRGIHVSGSFVALVLAMTLLGPAPAVAIGVLADLIAMFGARKPRLDTMTDLISDVSFPLAGGLLCAALVGNVHAANNPRVESASFALVVFAVFLSTNVINFLVIAVNQRITKGRSLFVQTRDVFVPVLPGQFAAAGLAAILACAYVQAGYTVLVGVVAVLGIFQYLAIALYRSEERAEQLRARTVRLASMQLGMLTTLVETLNMRDSTTGRHAAAVARHARDLAREIGCDETEQDQAHTAGLLHDVGKFAWPDRVLHAHQLAGSDVALVRRHPQDGAALVGRLDGYGPIADIILYHHERMDGTGYPAGLIGKEIPLLSRVIAVCEAYDTLTARDSYREARTPYDALSELRQASGTQFDPDVVDAFGRFLKRSGALATPAPQRPEFVTELDFERRAEAIAAPARSIAQV